jgi:RNA polymerase sigma-70 factor (ECF subfamily)
MSALLYSGIVRAEPVTTPKGTFITALEATHGRNLRRFLSARLRGASADVPDLVQEIFLRLLRIKDHEAIRNPQAYLFTVATHVLHQYTLQRSAKTAVMDPLDLAVQLQAPPAAPDPAEELEITEQIESIGRGLQQLSPRAYAVLVMYRCEGMTLVEIGKRLGISHVMARKYLIRAIAYCDERLKDAE